MPGRMPESSPEIHACQAKNFVESIETSGGESLPLWDYKSPKKEKVTKK